MSRTRIFLIRHGMTEWNKKKKYCGFKDVGLNPRGRMQADRLRRRLECQRFERVYVSDRKRAIQTARIIFGRDKAQKIDGLREINFGEMEGLSHSQVLKKCPIAYKKWLADPFRNHIPGAERLPEFGKRVNAAMRKIARLNRGRDAAVVCHGGTISIFVTGIIGKKGFWRYVPDSASLSIVEYRDGRRPEMKLFNCTKHL